MKRKKKVIVAPDVIENNIYIIRGQKVMLCFDLCSKLVYRVNRRIDIPPKSFLGWLYRRDDIAEGRFPNDQQIDVAGGVELTPRSRAEHECRLQAICERHQRVTQDVHEPCSLGEQAL